MPDSFLYAVSCYSLFPLLYEVQEYPLKVLLLTFHVILMWYGFSSQFSETVVASTSAQLKKRGDNFDLKKNSGAISRKFTLNWIEKSYLLGLLLVELWCQFLHPALLGSRLPFLRLMMISIYCAFGMMYSWMWQLHWIIKSH